MTDHPPEHGSPLDDLGAGPEPLDHEEPRAARPGGSRRAERRRRRPMGCLIVAVVVLVAFAGGLYLVAGKVGDLLAGLGGDPDDYAGGTPVAECASAGEVDVTIAEGDTLRQMGNHLAELDVVASSDAFVAAAGANDRSNTIQVGPRAMCSQMSASEAVELLVDTSFIDANGVTVPEGLRVNQIVERLAEATGIPAADFTAVLDDPAQLAELGLPESANGDAEGYLFPATYDVGGEPTAAGVIGQMISRWNAMASDVGLVDGAVPGFSQHELLTIASIIEREVLRDDDRPAVAEVVYDRLAGSCVGVPVGRLEMDSTINFISGGGTGTPYTSAEARQVDSPYNTYLNTGLPPGPIASPGQAAMAATIAPTDEGYCFFVAVDLATGETAFAAGYTEHLANVERGRAWCRENDHSGCP